MKNNKYVSASTVKMKDAISSSGMSIKKVSEMVGANPDYFGKLFRNSKNGKCTVKAKYFYAFCQLLNADPDDISKRPRASKKTVTSEEDFEQFLLPFEEQNDIEEESETLLSERNLTIEFCIDIINALTCFVNGLQQLEEQSIWRDENDF